MITDYGTLKTAITDWLVRDAEGLPVADLIGFAERKIYRGFYPGTDGGFVKGLRTPLNERIATWTANSSASIKIPADYLEAKMFTCNDRPLERLDGAQVLGRQADSLIAEPTAFGRVGAEFYLDPPPDGAYEFNLVYYADLSGGLSDDEDTNELLRVAPDIYLYGALREAEPYLKNDARVATWTALFVSGLEALNQQAFDAELSGSPLTVQSPYA